MSVTVARQRVEVAWPLATSPWPHQHEALNWSIARPGCMLHIGMGGGKTAAAIAIAEHHHVPSLLVLCPNSVVDVWPAQLEQHAARHWHIWAGEVRGKRGWLANPTAAQRAEALAQAQLDAVRLGRPFCAVVNFEAAITPAMSAALLHPWGLVAIDESHRIKAPGGATSRLCGRLGQRVRAAGGRMLAGTGTPFATDELDLYAQYRAIAPHIFGTSAAVFRARFAGRKVFKIARGGEPVCLVNHANEALQSMGARPHGRPIRTARPGEPIYAVGPRLEPLYEGLAPERLDEFLELANRVMFTVTQHELDESLGLPDIVDVHRTIALSPASRRVYRDLEEHLIADLGDGAIVTAANAMVNILRLAQAAQGFAVDYHTGTAIPLAGTPEKARLLADVLEDVNVREPVVVFARFHHDLDQIKEVAARQGRRYGELSGRAKTGMTDRATMRDDIDLLAVQIQSGGVGIDLTRARIGIYYSIGHALLDYLQSRKRLHRPGQTNLVTLIHLLAADTVDQAIYAALQRRTDIVTTVTQHLRARRTTP